jgi:hypothetical protein
MTGPAAVTARALNTRWNNLSGGGLTGGPMGRGVASKLQGALYRYYDKFLNKSFYPRFYDGVLPGPPPRVLEIKGPTDSFNTKHGPGQAADLNSLSPQTAVVSCQSCKTTACHVDANGNSKCGPAPAPAAAGGP